MSVSLVFCLWASFFLLTYLSDSKIMYFRALKQAVCVYNCLHLGFSGPKILTANTVLDTILLVLCVLWNLLLVFLFASVPTSHLDSLLCTEKQHQPCGGRGSYYCSPWLPDFYIGDPSCGIRFLVESDTAIDQKEHHYRRNVPSCTVVCVAFFHVVVSFHGTKLDPRV
jgi:hypothetical protein